MASHNLMQNMICSSSLMGTIVSHPTGNTFVRALLHALVEHSQLRAFFTTFSIHPDDFGINLLPERIKRQVERRSYGVPQHFLYRFPVREIARLAAPRLKLEGLTRHETGWASVDAVYNALDRRLAERLAGINQQKQVNAVYCYEDGALNTFRVAKRLGVRRVYDLPIAYWEAGTQLLGEEAERWPEWEPTLIGTRDSKPKLERKTAELHLADTIIVPSLFVLNSLPAEIRATKVCHVVEFGSPLLPQLPPRECVAPNRPLRVLFAGSMSQRKGLADIFEAMKLVSRSDVELVVLGSPIQPLSFYKQQYSHFRHESPRPHNEVLELMQSCDIFVLPSIVEGRALVQQEALACGLPLIVTPNAGAEDLIEEGETGFLVPIRSPEKIAEKINWFADHREELPRMRESAIAKAAQYTWRRYGETLVHILTND